VDRFGFKKSAHWRFFRHHVREDRSGETAGVAENPGSRTPWQAFSVGYRSNMLEE